MHGHRNNFNRFVKGNSINLNIDDKFRWLTIYPDGKLEPHEINHIDVPPFDEQMRVNPYIKTKDAGDNITAFNFTSEAFRKNIWDNQTIRARGFFVDNEHNIIGRGFSKFFEIGQMPEANIDNLEYPIRVYRKHNGFLLLVMYDTKNNKLHVFSKSGNTPYAKMGKGILKQTNIYPAILSYYMNKKNQHTTLAFEIVDSINDAHIAKYNRIHAYPLAIIDNTLEGKVLNIKRLNKEQFKDERLLLNEEMDSMINKIEDSLIGVAFNKEQLQEIINEDKQNNPLREGLVLYGKNMMLKIKYPFYHSAKELRNALKFYKKKGKSKTQWYYPDSKKYFKLCVILKETDFSPELAKKLYYFDKKYDINETLMKLKNNQMSYNELKTNFKNI